MDDKKLILIVEDDSYNAEILSRHLQRLGHKGDIASNGKVGLEKLAQKDYDLVLLDINMPVMDGHEFLLHIAKLEDKKHIPVVMTTAVNETDSVNACITMGAREYILKPFKFDDIKQRLAAWL